jgi:exopolysaccharide biosynthesis polyprenyl glycosylphosphotransferase
MVETRPVRFAARHTTTVEAFDIPVAPSPHFGYTWSKRGIDIVAASALLLLLSPLLLLACIAIKLTSPGPLFFRQERYGRGGRTFRIWKLRTMVAEAEDRIAEAQEHLSAHGHDSNHHGPAFKSKDDPRVTPLGRVLRRTSLDEIPQLFNVLQGSMSLVGPRPLVRAEVDELTPEQVRRHAVKPGITCIWQTSGRSRVPYEQRMQMDLAYVDHRSLWLDLWLLLKTPLSVLKGDGAY